MTTEELEQAVRERTVEVARLTARVEELENTHGDTLDQHGNRLWTLERQARMSEDSQRELSAHLNGMTYP